MVFTNETYSVDNAVNSMTSTFTSVLNNRAKLRQKRVKRCIQPAWFNVHIRNAILSRNRAKRNGNVLMYKKVRNNLVNMVRKAKSLHYHNAVRNSKGNSKVLWKHMRELTGKTCKNSVKALKLNNDICSDPKQIADEFNLYFTSIAEEILNAQPNKCSSDDYEHN